MVVKVTYAGGDVIDQVEFVPSILTETDEEDEQKQKGVTQKTGPESPKTVRSLAVG
jgi:hypothetical protein